MTIERAIEILEDSEEDVNPARRMAVLALEKQLPKKIVHTNGPYDECPSCGYIQAPIYKFCPKCGQKIDWRGEA